MRISYEWDFGEDEALAKKLAQLVLEGQKKATTGLYQAGQQIPKIGECAAIVDSDKKRLCVIQYTRVEIKPFLEVDYDFAQKEGEGDADIEEWREKHRKFFKLTSDDVKVLCEEFVVTKSFR